ncbi:thiamine pyrophosphate-dependent dehydrogenase E1 component subunit alpha [Candidatus Caldatribacterium sp. SIUC1]|uniref:thiamine pyrophosphate-dependent dehydrogenase E1 component subunit alpha n=1 Tax=Candidatus Caldatribacterium sp. SIUC1 TaxID=3418365 RepID=UPI003F68EF74
MLSVSDKLKMYLTMLCIRRFEEKAEELYMAGKIWGTFHLYIGEEAVATGACFALRPEDYITSTHRGHGHCIAKGADVRKMMAELMGKATGYCLGLGGSMHIADLEGGNLGATGIVGSAIPIAVGAALACKLQRNNRVVLCFFGDGAANTGAFHEAVNLAAVFKLPVVFLCENNLYAMSFPVKKAFAIPDIAERAKGYGIPGVTVDGMDVLSVYEATKEAVDRARKGEGPTLIEARTYRFKGHSKSDKGVYRTKEEVRMWTERCPIKRFREYLLGEGVPEEALKDLEKKAEELIEEAVRFAEESPELTIEEARRLVYA